MKPFRAALVAVVLAGGVWGAVACGSRPMPAPEIADTLDPDPKIERPAQAGPASEPAPQTEVPPLIGTLRSRSHTIHLHVGRITVEDANGRV